MPDARLQRTRENYPEGVPMFGTWMEATMNVDGKPYRVSGYPTPRIYSVSESEVPRPPLAATEPPAVQPSTDPQAAYVASVFVEDLGVNGFGIWCARCRRCRTIASMHYIMRRHVCEPLNG